MQLACVESEITIELVLRGFRPAAGLRVAARVVGAHSAINT